MKYEPRKKLSKLMLASIVFGVLKRGIKVCYKHDSNVHDILSKLPDGYVISLKVLPEGPTMLIKKTEGKIVNAKKDEHVDLEVCFKNVDVAIPVLLGKTSIADTYKHSSIITYGSVGDTVEIVGMLNIVESYLFPKMIMSKILDKPYDKQKSSFRIYLGIFLGV